MSEGDRSESNRLTGRVSRYARVGTSVGKVAARMGAERLFGLETNSAEAAAALRTALGGLKGPLMKVAQLLATIPDALPAEYAGELAQLQSNAPAMGWPFVRRRMASELGPDWQDKYKSFEHEAAAAASLGQVHRAVSHDGRDLACKLQYPDMQSAVEADLNQLKIIFAVYRRYDRAIDPSRIHDEIAARLREELDYDREARHQSLYRMMLKDQAMVHVPEVVPELSTKRLLTMDWMDGEPLMNFLGETPEHRAQLAMAMFHAWYVPFYGYGVIHGDPQSRQTNKGPAPDMSVSLLDFGCVRVFHARFVRGVIDLYKRARDRRPRPRRPRLRGPGVFTGLLQRGHRYAAPVGGVHLRASARGQTARHPRRGQHVRRAHRIEGAWPPARTGRRHRAARVRLHGPRRHRARLRLHAPGSRGQLA